MWLDERVDGNVSAVLGGMSAKGSVCLPQMQTHTYAYTYTCTCTHTYTYTYTHTHIHTPTVPDLQREGP